MKLAKELLSLKQHQVTEARIGDNEHMHSHDFDMFMKITNQVDDYIDHLHDLFKEGSAFTKLIERLGGDHKVVALAQKHLKALEEEFRDIQMSTGMAHDEKTGAEHEAATHEDATEELKKIVKDSGYNFGKDEIIEAKRKGDKFIAYGRNEPDDNYIVFTFHMNKDGKTGDYGGAPLGEYDTEEEAEAAFNKE